MGRISAPSRSRGPGSEAKSTRGRNRREMILSAAASLFHRQGFHETGIDEIGAAVGITGPGVYRHFESKQHLLAAILDRSMERHQEILTEVNACGLPASEALTQAHRSVGRRSGRRTSDAAAIYFQEARNLAFVRAQRVYTRIQRILIREWVHLLRNARPDLSEEDAHVAVRAAGGLLNSVGLLRHVDAATTGWRKLLADMCYAALLADPKAH